MKNIWRCLSLIVASGTALSQVIPTPTWVDVYSNASTLNGQPLPVGAVVRAYDPQGMLCGEFVVHTPGAYGYLHVYGDDATTSGADEGAVEGDTITFRIQGVSAIGSVAAVWTGGTPGALVEVHLQAIMPPPPAPELIEPAAGAVELPTTIVFRWTTWLLWPFGEIRGHIQVATDTGFTVLAIDSSGIVGDSLRMTGLTKGGVYFWRVRYRHALAGNGPFSVVRMFSTTTTFVDTREEIPEAPVLHQNFPNPFNPLTNIRFRLPAGRAGNSEFGFVKLTIYDLLGREAAVLINTEKPAGEYAIVWDGSQFPSGVYICRLDVAGLDGAVSKLVAKIVLAK